MFHYCAISCGKEVLKELDAARNDPEEEEGDKCAALHEAGARLLQMYLVTEAETALDEAEELSATCTPAERAALLRDLGLVQLRLARWEDGVALFDDALELFLRAGDDHKLDAMRCEVCRLAGLRAAPRGQMEELLARCRAAEHAGMQADVLHLLCAYFTERGMYKSAAAAGEDEVDLCRETFGDFDARTAAAIGSLAKAFRFTDGEKCLALREEQASILNTTLGAAHPVTLLAAADLALARAYLRGEEEEWLREEARAALEKVLPLISGFREADTCEVLDVTAELARVHLQLGNERRGLSLVTRAMETATAAFGEGSFHLAAALVTLADLVIAAEPRLAATCSEKAKDILTGQENSTFLVALCNSIDVRAWYRLPGTDPAEIAGAAGEALQMFDQCEVVPFAQRSELILILEDCFKELEQESHQKGVLAKCWGEFLKEEGMKERSRHALMLAATLAPRWSRLGEFEEAQKILHEALAMQDAIPAVEKADFKQLSAATAGTVQGTDSIVFNVALALAALAKSHSMAGDPETSVGHYDRALCLLEVVRTAAGANYSPTAEAAILTDAALEYRALGLEPETRLLLQQAVQLDARGSPEALVWLSCILVSQGNIEDGKAMMEDGICFAAAASIPPEFHSELLSDCAASLDTAGDVAGATHYRRRAVAILEEDTESVELLTAMHELADALGVVGEDEEACDTLARAVALSRQLDEPMRTALLLGELSTCCLFLERFDEAEARAREALAIRSDQLGPAHSLTLASHTSLIHALRVNGKHDEAAAEAATALDRASSEAVATVSLIQRAMALTKAAMLQYQEALALNMAILERLEPLMEESSEQEETELYANVLEETGLLLMQDMSDCAGAVPYLEKAPSAWHAHHDGDHPAVARALTHLGACLTKAGQQEEAVPHLMEAVRVCNAVFQRPNQLTATAHRHLAAALPEKEVETRLQALRIAVKVLGDVKGDHPDTARAIHALGTALLEAAKPDEAKAVLEAAVVMFRATLGDTDEVAAVRLQLAGLDRRGA